MNDYVLPDYTRIKRTPESDTWVLAGLDFSKDAFGYAHLMCEVGGYDETMRRHAPYFHDQRYASWIQTDRECYVETIAYLLLSVTGLHNGLKETGMIAIRNTLKAECKRHMWAMITNETSGNDLYLCARSIIIQRYEQLRAYIEAHPLTPPSHLPGAYQPL